MPNNNSSYNGFSRLLQGDTIQFGLIMSYQVLSRVSEVLRFTSMATDVTTSLSLAYHFQKMFRNTSVLTDVITVNSVHPNLSLRTVINSKLFSPITLTVN